MFEGASSPEDSEDESDVESDDVSSFSSKNSNTLGTCFAGSAGLSGEDCEAAGGFSVCFGALLFSAVLGLSARPACESCVELETVDDVLFLPSFFDLQVRRLWELVWSGMVIGKGRKDDWIQRKRRLRVWL